MMINRRRAYGNKESILPAGYTQLEYIKNTTNAYILLPFYANDSTTIKIEFYNSQPPISTGQYIAYYRFGTRTSQGVGGYFALGGDADDFYAAIGTHNNYIFNISGINANYAYLSIGNGEWCLNEYSGLYTEQTFTSRNPFTLFRACNDSKGTAIGYSLKYWYIGGIGKVFITDKNVDYTLIPCINPNNVVGMYDTVEGKFYSSPNGTAFIAGPEV